MMSENRIFRAVVTFATLALCMAFLQVLHPRQSAADFMPPAAEAVPAVQTPAPVELPRDTLPPVPVQRLPLAAFDNTCFDGAPRDLSAYTGWLSGGAAREYHLFIEAGTRLDIEAEPQFDWFDLSFVLLNAAGEAVAARDEEGPGQTERGAADITASGNYRLVIGCYGSECGTYRLAVRDELPPLAQIEQNQIHKGRNGAVIRWRSFGETGLSHFSVFRITGDDRRRVATLRAHGSPADFANYRYTDRSPQADRYELEAVGRDGRREVISLPS